MELTVRIKKEEEDMNEMQEMMTLVKDATEIEIRHKSTDWQLNAHCDQLLTGKEEMCPEMKLKTRIKEEMDQKLMEMVKKEPLDEMEMNEQLLQTKEELQSDDEESSTTFTWLHQSEQLAGNVSSLAFTSLGDDSDRMPSDWFCGESSDSEEATVDEASVVVSADSVSHFPIKEEPQSEDTESLSAFASPQPASPSIVVKGETCPCTGDCLDCQAKRSHPCPECGKTFYANADLKKHLRVHTGERPYVCAQCPKAFAQSGTLTRHQATHQAVRSRPFKCTAEGCGKDFTAKGELTRHLRVHKSDKPYKCDSCGKAFTQSGTLKIHFRLHTGDRPYRCPLCPKAFAQLSHAKSHKRTAHPGSP